MQLSVFMCTDWTEHATVLQQSLAEPPPPYHQGDEVSAKTPLRGLLCSRQMTVCVLLAYLIKTIGETLPLATHLNQFNRPDTGHTRTQNNLMCHSERVQPTKTFSPPGYQQRVMTSFRAIINNKCGLDEARREC